MSDWIVWASTALTLVACLGGLWIIISGARQPKRKPMATYRSACPCGDPTHCGMADD